MQQALSASQERYLNEIYQLCQNGGEAHVTDIAAALDVSKPSVCRAVQVLEERGLVRRVRFGPLVLTAYGCEQAALLCKRRQAVSHFLTEMLGLECLLAEQLAAQVAPVVSDEVIRRLAAAG